MKIPAPQLCGLVLAGGRSTRMGTDKAALVHPDGRTLARRACDLLLEAGCGIVALSLRHDQEIPAGVAESGNLTIVRDPAGGSEGPVAGLVSGVRLHPEADWLVIACDLPRLDAATLSGLLASKMDGEKFLSYRSGFDGLPEPLCALYGRGSLGVLGDALADDLRSVRQILIRNHCRLLDPVSQGALVNANTPGEWASAILERSDDEPPVRESESLAVPEWNAELLEIWISGGNDFRGRHGQGRLNHEIRSVGAIECVAGMGLRGDRYFGYKENFKGQVTFLSAETVQAVRDEFEKPDLSSATFRRNLVVRGVDLSDWLGKRFRFQGVEFEGSEECKPCYWMDEVAAPGAEAFLNQEFRGGLRARILTGGVLRAVR